MKSKTYLLSCPSCSEVRSKFLRGMYVYVREGGKYRKNRKVDRVECVSCGKHFSLSVRETNK